MDVCARAFVGVRGDAHNSCCMMTYICISKSNNQEGGKPRASTAAPEGPELQSDRAKDGKGRPVAKKLDTFAKKIIPCKVCRAEQGERGA